MKPWLVLAEVISEKWKSDKPLIFIYLFIDPGNFLFQI